MNPPPKKRSVASHVICDQMYHVVVIMIIIHTKQRIQQIKANESRLWNVKFLISPRYFELFSKHKFLNIICPIISLEVKYIIKIANHLITYGKYGAELTIIKVVIHVNANVTDLALLRRIPSVRRLLLTTLMISHGNCIMQNSGSQTRPPKCNSFHYTKYYCVNPPLREKNQISSHWVRNTSSSYKELPKIM